jgi:hypothetical protein
MPISKPTAPSTTDPYRRSAVEKEAAKVIEIASAAFFLPAHWSRRRLQPKRWQENCGISPH